MHFKFWSKMQRDFAIVLLNILNTSGFWRWIKYQMEISVRNTITSKCYKFRYGVFIVRNVEAFENWLQIDLLLVYLLYRINVVSFLSKKPYVSNPSSDVCNRPLRCEKLNLTRQSFGKWYVIMLFCWNFWKLVLFVV